MSQVSESIKKAKQCLAELEASISSSSRIEEDPISPLDLVVERAREYLEKLDAYRQHLEDLLEDAKGGVQE